MALALAAALCAPAVAVAGTATSDGGTARFADPAGVADQLAADLELVGDEPNVDPPGWSVSFLEATPGAGCQEGFVGTLCPFGPSPPGAIAIDLGAGDDALDFGVKAATTPPTTIALSGGAGNDRIATVHTRAELDGGDGDDLLLPDERWAFDFPPDPTPGGVIRGGAGTDTVSYELALDPIDVSLDGVANDGRGGEGDDVRADVENILGSEFGGALGGSAAANRIVGAEGPDRIAGGAGRDTLVGFGGNDAIDALDAAGGDAVSCGEGDDDAIVDAGDKVTGDCENVAWAPRLVTTRPRVRGGRMALTLACPRAASRCRGTVLLRSRAGRTRTLARAGYRIRRGRRATVRLAPKRRAVRATLLVEPAGAHAATGRAITIRR